MSAKSTTKKAAKKAPAKKAAKKAPAKKAPAKKAAKSPSVDLNDILSEDAEGPPVTFRREFTDAEAERIHGSNVLSVRESLNKLNSRTTKRPVNMLTPGMLRKSLMPVGNIFTQYMLGAVGFRYPSVIQLIGPESSGKTSFCMHLAGRLVDRGCPTIFIDCEDKVLPLNRVARLLDRDPRKAKLFYNSIYWARAFTLVSFDETVRQTVAQARENCDKNPHTKGNPIFVFADTWTTLMSAGEAQGRSDWGLGGKDKAKALKDTGTGSNFGHAKHAQGMKRWLPHFLRQHNATMVFSMHQNESITMVQGQQPTPKYKNTTTTGQKGIAQISSYIIVMTPAGDVQTTDKTTTGFNIRFYVAKSSYGPKYRSSYATLSFDRLLDTPEHYDDPFKFGEKTAEWMAQRGLLGTRITNKRYTCDTLGCTAVTGDELYAKLLSSPEQLAFLGAALDIEGYETSIEKRRANALVGVPMTVTATSTVDTSDGGAEDADTDGEGDDGPDPFDDDPAGDPYAEDDEEGPDPEVDDSAPTGEDDE